MQRQSNRRLTDQIDCLRKACPLMVTPSIKVYVSFHHEQVYHLQHRKHTSVRRIELSLAQELEGGWYMPIGENRRGQTHFHTIRVSRSK